MVAPLFPPSQTPRPLLDTPSEKTSDDDSDDDEDVDDDVQMAEKDSEKEQEAGGGEERSKREAKEQEKFDRFARDFDADAPLPPSSSECSSLTT